MRLEDAYDIWLVEKSRTVEAATMANYVHIGRRYIVPFWGDMGAAEVTRDHFLERLDEISPGQQARVKGVLAQCLDWTPGADGLSVRTVRLRNLNRDKRVRRVPTIGDAERIAVEADRYTHYGDLIRFAVYTGLRWGEIIALTPDDVDHELGLVDVNKAWCAVSKRLKGPKSLSSIREVVVHPDGMPALERAWYSSGEFMFEKRGGGRLEQGNFYTNVWSGARKRAGLTWRFHDLRHTYATLLIKSGLDQLSVSAMLGHSKPSVTYDIYAGFFDSPVEEVWDALRP